MINNGTKLTVNDLIVEYMIYKLENNYDTNFTITEFMDFLRVFQMKVDVSDVMLNGEAMFIKFFEYKAKNDWKVGSNDNCLHMNMNYNNITNDYIITPTYRLSGYDSSIISTSFMTSREVEKIHDAISSFLEDKPKRKITYVDNCTEEEITAAKCISAELVRSVWTSHIDKVKKSYDLPIDTTSINDLLLNDKVAPALYEVPMRQKLIDMYIELNKRLSSLYHEDKNLEISNLFGGYLSLANYNLLKRDYEKLLEEAFSIYKSRLLINMEKGTFRTNNPIEHAYGETEYQISECQIPNQESLKLAKKLDFVSKK